jgi:hypothetical protein
VSEYDIGGYQSSYRGFDYNACEWEEGDSSTTIKELRDAKGEYISQEGFSPEDEDFMDKEWSETLGDPTREEYEGNLGNESATRETTYKTAVLVLWPTTLHTAMMLSLGREEYSLDSLMALLEDDGSIKGDLPLGAGSAREWLDSAIRHERSNWEDNRYPGSACLPQQLLAMQGMIKLGSSEDVVKLLKTFTPLLDASEMIQVRRTPLYWYNNTYLYWYSTVGPHADMAAGT